MKLTIPANYDLELVPKLAEHPVAEVYGKLPGDLVGGGRPSYMGTPLNERALGRYVAALQQHGIAFNYLLNSSCQGNREWTRRWRAVTGRVQAKSLDLAFLSDGGMVLTDNTFHRVCFMDAKGNYRGEFGLPGSGTGSLNRPSKIAVDWHILHFPDSGPPDKLIAEVEARLRNPDCHQPDQAIIAANSPREHQSTFPSAH